MAADIAAIEDLMIKICVTAHRLLPDDAPPNNLISLIFRAHGLAYTPLICL